MYVIIDQLVVGGFVLLLVVGSWLFVHLQSQVSLLVARTEAVSS